MKIFLGFDDTDVLGAKMGTGRLVRMYGDKLPPDTRLWGVVVFRDFYEKENLWWKFVDDEATSAYEEGKAYLESLGYVIVSATCDGLPGLLNVFKGIPVQFCHFHQAQIVRRYTTLNPKISQGHELLELVKVLTFTEE